MLLVSAAASHTSCGKWRPREGEAGPCWLCWALTWEWGRRADLRQSQEVGRCWEDSGGGKRIRSSAHWPGVPQMTS